MEVECNRHPGASTNDRQLLDETDFFIFFPVSHGWQILATQPWVPMQVRRRASIKLIWYTVETKEGWVGGITQKLCSNAEQPYNKHEESMHMWQENTADCTSFPILQYLLYLKACTGVQEHTEKNTWERRPLKDALVQVPHKTPLGTKECWHRQMDNNDCRPSREDKYSLLLTPLNYIWLRLKQIQYVVWLSIPYVIYF